MRKWFVAALVAVLLACPGFAQARGSSGTAALAVSSVAFAAAAHAHAVAAGGTGITEVVYRVPDLWKRVNPFEVKVATHGGRIEGYPGWRVIDFFYAEVQDPEGLYEILEVRQVIGIGENGTRGAWWFFYIEKAKIK